MTRQPSNPRSDKDRFGSGGKRPTLAPGQVAKKRGLVVLGMHRSGTSAVTRVLSLLGAALPQVLMKPVEDDNELGFWEPQRVVDLNDEMLATMGRAWDDISPIPASWFRTEAASEFEDRAVEILRQDFEESKHFVLKDPRICRLMPFWLSVLKRFETRPSFIVLVRNPLEVAASLKRRNGLLPQKSCLLWLWHLLEAERATRGCDRSFVHYHLLLRDWRATIDQISADISLEWPYRSHATDVEIERFLSDRHRHHNFDLEDLNTHSSTVDWVRRAYSTMIQGAGEQMPIAEALDAIRVELLTADKAFGPLLAAARLDLAIAETDVRRLNQEVDRNQGQLESTSQEIGRITHQLAQQEESIASERADYRARSESTSQEIDRITHQLAQQEESIASERADYRARLESASKEIDRFTHQLAQQEKSIASERADYRARLVGSGETIERLRRDLLAEQGRRTEQDREVSQLGQELERSRRNIALHQRRLEVAREAIQQLRTSLRSRERELSTRDQEIDLLITLRDQRVEDLRTQVDSLSQDLSRNKASLTRLRKENQEVSQGLSEGLQRETRLANSLANTELQAERLSMQVAQQQRSLRSVMESRSWRGTQPIRSLWDTLSRVPRFAGILAAAFKNKVGLRKARELAAISESSIFDSEYYASQLPEEEICPDLLLHFVKHGVSRRFSPNPLFDTKYYLEQNPDVTASGQNPLAHYLEHGAREGRDPHPRFSSARYVEVNADVAEAGMNPLSHYVLYGAPEGRAPGGGD